MNHKKYQLFYPGVILNIILYISSPHPKKQGIVSQFLSHRCNYRLASFDEMGKRDEMNDYISKKIFYYNIIDIRLICNVSVSFDC